MYVIKVKLARDIGGLYRRMSKMMDEMMNINRPCFSRSGEGWIPEADIIETEDELRVLIDLAGVSREDIDVSYDETYLRVEGTRSSGIPPGTPARYHQMEMGFGKFERVFRVPVPIDPVRIEAVFSDGLLVVRLKKPDRTARVVAVKD